MAKLSVNLYVLGRIGLIVLAGVSWPFACSGMFRGIGYDVLLLQIHLFQWLGIHSGASLKALLLFTDPIIWAAVFGFLFGLPLALLVRKNVMRYWWLFFMTVLFLAVEFDALNLNNAIETVSEIVLSPFPVYHTGILVIWFLTAKALSRRQENLKEEAPVS